MSKKYLAIIGIIVLALILPISVYFIVTGRFKIQNQASTPNGSAKFTITNPLGETVGVGQTLPITINLQTPELPGGKGVTGIKVTLDYVIDGSSPVTITEADITTLLPSPWNYLHKEITPVDDTTTKITIEAVFLPNADTPQQQFEQLLSTGYTDAVSTPQAFATLNFHTIRPGSLLLQFEVPKNEVRSKDQNIDILNADLPIAPIQITDASSPTNTPTPTPLVSLTPTPTGPLPTLTPTPIVPTLTPTPGYPPSPTPLPNQPQPTPVIIDSMVNGQTLTTSRPRFSGRASPNARIDILIQSDPIAGQITADQNGNWSWVPPQDLPPGTHTISVTATDTSGNQTTTTYTFGIQAGAAPTIPATGGAAPTLAIGIAAIVFVLISLGLLTLR